MTSSSSAESLVAFATVIEFDRAAAIADPTNGSAVIRAPCTDPAILFVALRVRLDFAMISEELDESVGINNAEKLDRVLRANWRVVGCESIHRAAEHRLHYTT